MKAYRLGFVYEKEVLEFLEYIRNKIFTIIMKKIYCPCVICVIVVKSMMFI